MHGSHGAGGAKLLPGSKLTELDGPEPSIERVDDHHKDLPLVKISTNRRISDKMRKPLDRKAK